uniref:ZSWIM1/3 RNaseH-like domain-containing protein n=1 Tax=Lactuca sativa TaxID=4236 RepID=A0A9R1VFP7_LACSA|nr:hypothetical protein LSAT_V11C500248840 [Lactuca sativa]
MILTFFLSLCKNLLIYFFKYVFESRNELMEWTDKNSVVSYITLICDRDREYEISHIKKYDGWTLRGHVFASRLKEHENQLVVDLTNQNFKPHDILSILKECDENNFSTLKTIYNARLKLRLSRNFGKTPMKVLVEILMEKHFVMEFSVNYISNELENLFFVHSHSLNIWKTFPHVLIIDATYKTNKYCMPFVQISTLDKCMHPRVIAIDRELVIACQQFVDDTLLKNIRKHWRGTLKLDDEWKSFHLIWTILVDSPTWILYTKNYKTPQSMLRNIKINNIYIITYVLNYLDEVWLNKYKEIMNRSTDQHLNFGQRTTNKVESAQSNLKKYLDGTNSSLDKFIGCLDQFARSQLTSIHSPEKSRIIYKQEHGLPCFRLLWGSLSHEALDKLVRELYRLSENHMDSSNYGCKRQHNCGLPCACLLSIYLNSIKSKKNNYDKKAKRYVPTKNNNKNKLILQIKLPERHSYPTTSKYVGLDLTGSDNQRARHNSYVTAISGTNEAIPDMNEAIPDFNEFLDLNQGPQSCYIHPLMVEIPLVFHPYVSHIQNVEGDGHCRFQSASNVYATVFKDGIHELWTSLYFFGLRAPTKH